MYFHVIVFGNMLEAEYLMDKIQSKNFNSRFDGFKDDYNFEVLFT